MKIATWNVNGIRARQVELQELLATEQPDVLCLQEIKALPEQVPDLLVAPDGYWCYWHGGRGYSGVALLVRRALCASTPVFSHPPFDLEQRIVVADLGPGPHRLGLRAQRRQGLRGQDSISRGAGRVVRRSWRSGPAAGGLRRPERRP